MLRLVAYKDVDDNCFANARFLDLKEAVGEGGDCKVSKVMSELAAETSLRKMVKDLNDALEKQGIDMTVFKANQFAALSVYYAKFLTQATTRTKHWLNRRYCCGLRQYVPGHDIEPKEMQQEHLASRCLPNHYDASGASQPAGLEQSGQVLLPHPLSVNSATRVFLVSTHLLRIADRYTKALLNTGNVPSTKPVKQDCNHYCHGSNDKWPKASSSFASSAHLATPTNG